MRYRFGKVFKLLSAIISQLPLDPRGDAPSLPLGRRSHVRLRRSSAAGRGRLRGSGGVGCIVVCALPRRSGRLGDILVRRSRSGLHIVSQTCQIVEDAKMGEVHTFSVSNELGFAMIFERQELLLNLPIELLRITPWLIIPLVQKRSPYFRSEVQLPSPGQLRFFLNKMWTFFELYRLLGDFIVRPDLLVLIILKAMLCAASEVRHQPEGTFAWFSRQDPKWMPVSSHVFGVVEHEFDVCQVVTTGESNQSPMNGSQCGYHLPTMVFGFGFSGNNVQLAVVHHGSCPTVRHLDAVQCGSGNVTRLRPVLHAAITSSYNPRRRGIALILC